MTTAELYGESALTNGERKTFIKNYIGVRFTSFIEQNEQTTPSSELNGAFRGKQQVASSSEDIFKWLTMTAKWPRCPSRNVTKI